MGENTISTEEWLSELARLTLKDSEGETMEEMCKRTGLRKETLSRALVAAREVGRLRVGRRHGIGIDGRRYGCPVYLVLPPASGQKNGTPRRPTVSKPQQKRTSVNRSPQSRKGK